VSNGEAAGLPGYAWDGARYRNVETGRYVSRRQVLTLLKAVVDEGEDRLRALARATAKGWITPAHFEAAAQRVLKYTIVANAALAAGGWERLDVGAYDRAGTLMAQQFAYLAGFARDLGPDGRSLSAEQAAARASLYAGAAYSAFWEEDRRAAIERGLTVARWRAVGDDRTCEDCMALERRGPAPIETFPLPGDGSTACLGNCRCDLVYVE